MIGSHPGGDGIPGVENVRNAVPVFGLTHRAVAAPA